jgi:hypothetical protein
MSVWHFEVKYTSTHLKIVHKLSYIIRVMKSRRMRWVAHVAYMGDAYKILIEKLEGKRH